MPPRRLFCVNAHSSRMASSCTHYSGPDRRGAARAEVAHLAYLTPPHKRKGKGGRQPAADPRLDPNIDPKRARRILANRLSAARSKMKQKSHVDVRALCSSGCPPPIACMLRSVC